MAKQIGNIEIKYSKNGILLKDDKSMIVVPSNEIGKVVETLIDLM